MQPFKTAKGLKPSVCPCFVGFGIFGDIWLGFWWVVLVFGFVFFCLVFWFLFVWVGVGVFFVWLGGLFLFCFGVFFLFDLVLGIFVWVFFLIWWLQERQLHLLNNYLLLFHFSEFRMPFLSLILCIGSISLHLQCLKFACPRLLWTLFIVKRPNQVPPKGDSSGLS